MGTASYFHVEVDKTNSRIIMDLSQVQRSRLSESELKKVFAGSPYLALESIAYDPEDRATNLILNMKRPIKVEIFSPKLAKTPGRIILDVAPVPAGKSKRVRSSKTKGKSQ